MQPNWSLFLQAFIIILGPQWVEVMATDSYRDLDLARKHDRVKRGYYTRPLGNNWTAKRIIDSRLRTKRAMAVKNRRGSGRWPDGVIPYQITNDFSQKDRKKIHESMQEYMKFSCLRFKETVASNMIKIQNSDRCHAAIGMSGGVQILGLAPGCRHKDIILHELGHTLGLIHEHQRPDRNKYVSFHKNNVKDGQEGQFGQYSRDNVEDLGIPYDSEGIMEYGTQYFSKNGRDTLVSKRTDKILGPIRMDEWAHLTAGDVKAVNLMYPCTKKCPEVDPSLCTAMNGYVGKDCKCWCYPSLKSVEYEECDLFDNMFR